MKGHELGYGERVAVARLHALLELLPTALDKELAPLGVTAFERALLEALAEADDRRLRLSALATRTNATLPRLSRVVTALERKGLVVRMPCEADGRATNAVLTDAGARAYSDSLPVYEKAVRRLILDGLDDGGVERLADMAYAILGKLDPDRRLAITASGRDASPDAQVVDASECGADPAPACDADPAR
jgi:DNA-binding MarR family transcriptional regulator